MAVKYLVILGLFSYAHGWADSKSVIYSEEYIVVRRPQLVSFAAKPQRVRSLARFVHELSFSKKEAVRTETEQESVHTSTLRSYEPILDECVELLKDPAIVSCSPNYMIRVDAKVDSSFASTLPYTPTIVPTSRLDSGADIVVAVLDTGVDYNHPELANHMWKNSGEVEGNGLDDDNNGYIDDIFGIDAANATGNPMDENGHGTHVAGIILNQAGELGSQGTGRVKIMALRFLNAQGMGGLVGAIKAMEYLAMMKERGVDVRISNNSWGGAAYSEVLSTAVKIVTERGIGFVAAAGNVANDNDRDPEYPASLNLPNVVSVAAVDKDNNLAIFSNYGEQSVDIAAPGVGIVSTFPGSSHKAMSGTSMAAPHIAGQLAKLLLKTPQYSSSELVLELLNQAHHSSTLYGVINEGRLLGSLPSSDQTTLVGAPKETTQNTNNVKITKLIAEGINKNGSSHKFIQSGFGLKVLAEGKGSGMQSLSVKVGGYSCRNVVQISLNAGKGETTLHLRKIPHSIDMLRVLDLKNQVRVGIKVKRSKEVKNQHQPTRKDLIGVCRSLHRN
jgi:hypothetical protein